VATAYSAATPGKLRGPEHDAAWCDELAKWRGDAGMEAWDNLVLTMRGGASAGARIVVTTTPRPVKLMRRVMGADGVRETLGRAGMPAGSWRWRWGAMAAAMWLRMRAWAVPRPRLGRGRWRRARRGMARTGWWPRRTRAARWSRACCARRIAGCRSSWSMRAR